MEEHICEHETDFGILFTKIDYMTKALDSQVIAMDALKIAVDAAVKYQISMKSIRESAERERMPHLYKASIIISVIIGFSAILTALIIEFHK
jgi:hypothetical protein